MKLAEAEWHEPQDWLPLCDRVVSKNSDLPSCCSTVNGAAIAGLIPRTNATAIAQRPAKVMKVIPPSYTKNQ